MKMRWLVSLLPLALLSAYVMHSGTNNAKALFALGVMVYVVVLLVQVWKGAFRSSRGRVGALRRKAAPVFSALRRYAVPAAVVAAGLYLLSRKHPALLAILASAAIPIGAVLLLCRVWKGRRRSPRTPTPGMPPPSRWTPSGPADDPTRPLP